MGRFLVNLFLSSAVLYVVASLMPGVTLSGFGSALIACFILGIVNAVIKPIILILTLPITILTLGLFSLVINAIMIMIVSGLAPGFQVSGFFTALIVSIIMSCVNMAINEKEKR